jgi:hypothetical protein
MLLVLVGACGNCWLQISAINLQQMAGFGVQAQTYVTHQPLLHMLTHTRQPWAPVLSFIRTHTTQEPTQAELDPGMQALVVSAETVAGGEAINAGEGQGKFRQHCAPV